MVSYSAKEVVNCTGGEACVRSSSLPFLNETVLHSLAHTVCAVEHPRPLAELSPPRSTASLWSPKSSGPEADPQLTLPKCSGAKNNRQKKNQTQSKTITPKPSRLEFHQKTIKHDHKSAFPYPGQSQGHPQPPNCFPEADHSHDCRSVFFISRFEHGRDDCPTESVECQSCDMSVLALIDRATVHSLVNEACSHACFQSSCMRHAHADR